MFETKLNQLTPWWFWQNSESWWKRSGFPYLSHSQILKQTLNFGPKFILKGNFNVWLFFSRFALFFPCLYKKNYRFFFFSFSCSRKFEVGNVHNFCSCFFLNPVEGQTTLTTAHRFICRHVRLSSLFLCFCNKKLSTVHLHFLELLTYSQCRPRVAISK